MPIRILPAVDDSDTATENDNQMVESDDSMIQDEEMMADETKGSDPELVEGWETYRNEEYGFKFRYPADYDISIQGPEGDSTTIITMFNQKSRIYVAIEPREGQCLYFWCNEPIKSTVSANNIQWNYLGTQKYCDGFGCSPERAVYRINLGLNRYYLYFEDEDQEKIVLNSFKFTN
jgi:hypothetical protein